MAIENKKIVVLGIYKTRAALEIGLDRLKAFGFRNSDISALFASGDETKEFAHTKATKAPEGTASGVVSGAALGGILGWLAGIGTLAIPGVGPFIAAGPIMGLIAGAGIGGAVGGIAGALIGLGFPEYEAKRFEGRIMSGGMLMSVHCDNNKWRDDAKNILKETGAEDISSTTESSADRPVDKEPEVARDHSARY